MLKALSLSRGPGLIFLSILLAVFAFGGGLLELVGRWSKQEEYSHGFFIPFIALWFIWNRREALEKSLGQPAWQGFGVVLFSLVLLLLGELTAIFILIQTGFLLALIGLVWAFGGTSLLRLCILPIALLLFAIPLPYFVDAQLSWRLQLGSSFLGVEFLRMLGYSVFLEGNVIDLGVYKLQVVEACSGLRYLYPLLSIGFLMAYIYRAALGWRIALFLSTIPITVLMNSLRIAVVGILVERWGSGMADGFLHYFEGWVVFLACLLILVGEIVLLERFGKRRAVMDVLQVPVPVALAPAVARKEGLPWPMLLSMAGLLLVLMLVQLLGHREEEKPTRMLLSTFPLVLEQWQARESSLPPDVERGLGVDDYLLADYVDAAQGSVNFYVAYYGSQRKGVSPHSPQVCIPGGGWVISDISRVPVTLDDSAGFEAVRVVIARGGQRLVVYYWFEQRGRRIANEYLMKWYLLKDALLRNRTDGALVRVTAQLLPTEDIAVADRRLQAFARMATPKLENYVPH